MKRLLFIHQNYVSSFEAGNSRAERTIKSFLKSGWTVDLITSSRTYLGQERKLDEHLDGLTVHYVDCNYQNKLEKKGNSYWKFITESLKVCRKLSNFDLIYSSSPPLPQVLVGIYAALRFKSPVLGEVRDLWPLFIKEQLNSTLALLSLNFLELLFYHFSSRLICVSPGFNPYLKAMGIPSDKVLIFPSGIQTELPIWKAAQRDSDGFNLVYAGSLNEAYDLNKLIAAIIELRNEKQDVSLTIYGEGRNRSKYLDLSKSNDFLIVKKGIPRDELLSVLLDYDAAINIHSDWEFLGSTITGKLMDYLSVGIPVLNITRGIMSQIVEDFNAGVNSTSDQGSIKEAILELKESSKGLNDLKKKAWLREYFCSDFWNNQIVATANRMFYNSFHPKRKLIFSSIKSLAGILMLRPLKATRALRLAFVSDSINGQYVEWKRRARRPLPPLP